MDDTEKYHSSRKKLALLYKVAVAVFTAFLVFVVANDYEEQFFYSIMTLGASYAFRPNDQMINSLIKKFFDVDPPAS